MSAKQRLYQQAEAALYRAQIEPEAVVEEPSQEALFEVQQDTGYDVGVLPAVRQVSRWELPTRPAQSLYREGAPIVAVFITENGTRLPYTLVALTRRDLKRFDVPTWVLWGAGISCAENENKSEMAINKGVADDYL